jgi:hypothetical protein
VAAVSRRPGLCGSLAFTPPGTIPRIATAITRVCVPSTAQVVIFRIATQIIVPNATLQQVIARATDEEIVAVATN